MTEEDKGDTNWREAVKRHRKEKEATFESESESPLSKRARDKFAGLECYPVSKTYRFTGRLERFSEPEEVALEATRGQPIGFNHVGQLGVEVDGDLSVLAVYQAPGVDALLVPFRDATNGTETWSNGRYLNIPNETPKNGHETQPVQVPVDFNLAYQPLCVYDPEVRSAKPPADNDFETSIRAGERLPNKNENK